MDGSGFLQSRDNVSNHKMFVEAGESLTLISVKTSGWNVVQGAASNFIKG